MPTNLSTEKLMSIINNSPDIVKSISKYHSHFGNESVDRYLQELIEKYDCNISTVIIRSNLSKSFTYQIFNGTRTAGRDVLIRIAISIGIDLEETQYLLRLGDKSPLYPRIRRDAAIIFAIKHKYDLVQLDDIMASIEELPLL